MSENVNVATEVGVKTELEDTERAKIRAPRTKRGNLWSYIPLVLVALSFTLPLLFMISSSFKPRDEVLSDMTSWRAFVPVGDLSFDNYVGVFDRVPVGQVLPQLHHRHRGDRRPRPDRELDGRLRPVQDELSGRAVCCSSGSSRR